MAVLIMDGQPLLSWAVFWRALRTALWLSLLVAVIYVVRPLGRRPLWIAVVAVAVLWAAGYLWLPRAAHRAFSKGNTSRARLLYLVIAWLSIDPARRAQARLSVGATYLVEGAPERGLKHLAKVRVDVLGPPARAALLNNRAYALLRGGGDTAQALDDAEAAVALRPDVPGFRHTRAVAFLAVDRVDDAIFELDRMWSASSAESHPALEAERCYDLARAWQRKDERAYAEDYLERARRAAPLTHTAALAREAMASQRDPELPTSLADLV